MGQYRHQKRQTKRESGYNRPDAIVIDQCFLTIQASEPSEAETGSIGEHVPAYSGPAYDGGDIRQNGMPYPVVVNLATAKIAKNPQQMLKDHDPAKAIGHHVPVITATEMRMENGFLSVPNEHQREVVAAAKNGFPWQASIRGPYGKISLLSAGQKRTVNGRTVSGPRFIVDDFLWRETSATGLGANVGGPQFSIIASETCEGEDLVGFNEYCKTCGFDPENMSEDSKTALMAAWKTKFPETAASAGTGNGDLTAAATAAAVGNISAGLDAKLAAFNSNLEASAKAFEDRLAAVQAKELKAAQQRVDMAEVFGASGYDDLRASAIANSWDKERMMLERKVRDFEKAPPTRVDIMAHSGLNADGAPPLNEVVAAALAISGGVKPNELEASGLSQEVINAAESSRMRGLGYHAIIRMALQASGHPEAHSPTISPMEYGRLAGELQARYEFMRASGQIQASQAFSVMNLASITDDAINRSVHARFNAFQSVIPRVAAQMSARDFRPIYNYRVMGGGFLKKLSDSGELEHLKVSDAKFGIEADTQGAILSVPRKYVINDDLGIIKQLGDLLGFKGAQTLERDFHLMILQTALWRTTVGSLKEPINYITGAGSAFGYSAMKDSHHLWSNMQDREGNPINVGPTVLMVQSGSMALDARDLNKSEKVMVRSDNTAKDRTEANVFQGQLNNVVETQWLNHSSMGALKTATGWFQFSDPNVQPMFGVSYLDNVRVPKVETAPGSFNTLGQQMRVIFDYGMGQIDDIGAVFNKGAA